MKNRVGLGTFPLAGVFSKIDKEKAKEIVKLFLDNGGYYIDTAPLYGFGEVENILGDVLKDYPRESYYLITKCGYIDVEGKTFATVQKSGKYSDVIRECNISLKRLGLDFIDLYFIHSPDPDTPFEETMKALNDLQIKGKIKQIGVSNVNLEELKEYSKYGTIEFVQNRFSLINRSINVEFQQYLIDNSIGLIPYQVIDRGQLTESIISGIKFRVGDLRIGRMEWSEEKKNLIAKWSKENLLPIAKKLGITLSQLSIAWALHQKYLSFVIVGVTNPVCIPINLKATNIRFDESILKEINNAYQKLEEEVRVKYGQTVREFRGLNEKFY